MHNKQNAFIHLTQDGYNHLYIGSGREESCVTDKCFPSNALHGTKFKSYMVDNLLDSVQMLDRMLTKFIPNEVLTRSKISRIDRVHSIAYVRLNKEPE